MKTLKALSALLTYPSPALARAVPEIRDVLHDEGVLARPRRDALEPLLRDLAAGDLYDLQERYGMLFDRTRSLSLHLFEHVHGESRDRGQAMVDLRGVYEAAGFAIEGGDLPDFVPLFLEFCALRPPAEARQLLAEPAHVLAALGERLRKRDTAYAAVFEALVALAAAAPSEEARGAVVPDAGEDPTDLGALDAAWEEVEVRFGLGADAACGTESLAAKLRQARRPAPGVEVPGAHPSRAVFTHLSSRA
ncbi:nitrate reductase molybdenum cofactor assembly chaperone [Methylobacterium sp. 4-46]|uniref:nitrate reductase molybdenum cofactor assembly chaperone n=1 Tax=unclassified Methylobacterium TaxID=2615210 RepID=UPI000152E225|nr:MULTISPECIES: nitrate reductase molybdenum cofactor assembly chaperone [Methylobacterium]ACA19974.1 nitrate reductase molybdenum cofactor assembly chaperone [Methylobacterium sp. 4-46]WFT79159.1 nitrate reductase molybdenum cofactor assembly chaperone [Methylobacterium nodulans]